MEEENELSSEENNELNIHEIHLTKLKDLNLTNERAYLNNYILKYFIQDKFPNCKSKKVKTGEINKILNPLRLVCNNYKYMYRGSLRSFLCLKAFPKIHGSIFVKISYKFILEDKNAFKVKIFYQQKKKYI